MSDIDRRRSVQAEIRAAAAILRRDWDPIGHGRMEDLPADEYDSYAPRIVSLIEAGEDDQAIAAYLRQVEENAITLASRRDLLEVARLLRRAVAAASTRAT